MIFKRLLAAVLIILGILTIVYTLKDTFPQSTSTITTVVSQPISPTPFPQKNIYSGTVSYANDEKRILDSVATASSYLTTLHPDWYRLNTNGELESIPTSLQKEIQQIASEANVSVIPSILNNNDTNRTAQLLTSTEKQNKLISALIALAQEENYGGFTIHWEQINPTHGEDFTAFIGSLHEALKQINKRVYVTVSPRTGKPGDSEYSRTYDFVTLSKVSDFILINALDFHNGESLPGPIAPMNWYIDVITYAKTSIPLQKLIIKLPTYGYIWTDTEGTIYPFQDIVTILTKNESIPVRDSLSYALSGTFESNGLNTTWYEDTQSFLSKLEEAQSLGIYQFHISNVGGEDPTLWSRL